MTSISLKEETSPKVTMSLDMMAFLRVMSGAISDDVDDAYDGCSLDDIQANLSLQSIKVRVEVLQTMLRFIK
jgi:hypothetical protein